MKKPIYQHGPGGSDFEVFKSVYAQDVLGGIC